MEPNTLVTQETLKKPTVWVANFSGHPYIDAGADAFGEIAYITEGFVRQDRPDRLVYEIAKTIARSKSDDYLLLSGLLVVNVVAALLMLKKHGRVKLLSFDRNSKGDRGTQYREFVISEGQLGLLIKVATKAATGRDDDVAGEENDRGSVRSSTGV